MAIMLKSFFFRGKPRKKIFQNLNNIIIIFILFSSTLQTILCSPQSHFAKLSGDHDHQTISSTSISSACKTTPFPKACQSIFLSSKTTTTSTDSSTFPRTKQDLFDHSLQFSMDKALSARALAYNLSHTATSKRFRTATSNFPAAAMNDCLDLLDDTIDLLSSVVVAKRQQTTSHDDVHTWLSAALTNQETCLESLETVHREAEIGPMSTSAKSLSQLISNSLSLFLSSSKQNPGSGPGAGGRKLSAGGFPAWVSSRDRRLLEAPVEELKPHAVVAKDGSGTHGTIGEAIELAASLAEGGRSVIYIKAGTYNEYIKIPSKQKNVLLVGDGKGKTVIVGSKNGDDGSTTYDSATVGAMGDGFIAKDITFVNSAGPSKSQAVALRVGSDRSVVFRCSILGYQDTLYTLSKRQFYRETDIYGTVDFIFGNSAVVFQSCNISPRKPASSNGNNYVTAQGRTSPNQNTGISIHNCRISAASDLAPVKSKHNTYLGRPWKQYSRTVIMESFLDDSISPSGWSPWSGGSELKTLFYGEFRNTGPGASTVRRVNWAGYHPFLSPPQANSFTVAGFISGNVWLPSTGVSFDSGLLG